ncbi:MAG: HEPN domain-containing protein [Anaerolineales bacterium]
MEDLDVKGYWWLPKKPSRKLPGDLSFKPEYGAYLTLLGTFGEFTNRFEAPEIILGMTQEGKRITLFNLIPRNISWPIIGLGGSRYFAHFIFEGVHFKKKSDIKFHQVQASYVDLDAWVDTFGFKIEHGYSNKRKLGTPSISYSLPKSRLIELPDKTKVGVTFWSKGPSWNLVQTEAKITPETFLVAKSIQGDISFFDLNQTLSRLADLLQLATQRLSSPRQIIGFTDKNVESIGEHKRAYYPPVKVYFEPIEIQSDPEEKPQHDMLFTFKELTNRQIVKWFAAYENHDTQIYLYRSLIYNNRSFAETRFLNIVQALEALHSSLFKSHYLPPKTFELRKGKVINSAPPSLKNWLNNAIGNSNYKRLTQRALELLQKRKPLFVSVISDNQLFARRVVATRNLFIHQQSNRLVFAHGEELHCATLLLKFLFEAYLLQIMGFGSKKILRIYERRIRQYKSWGAMF